MTMSYIQKVRDNCIIVEKRKGATKRCQVIRKRERVMIQRQVGGRGEEAECELIKDWEVRVSREGEGLGRYAGNGAVVL